MSVAFTNSFFWLHHGANLREPTIHRNSPPPPQKKYDKNNGIVIYAKNE